MSGVFARIIAGELPGTFVWRDHRCVVFMSINPIATGHALVVPVEEIDHWLDASADLVAHLFEVTRVIGLAQRDAFACERIGVIVAGYEVPHAHIHVIPTNSMADVAFANAARWVDRADLEAAAAAIRARLRSMGRPEVTGGAEEPRLNGRTWRLVAFGGDEVYSDRPPEITLEDDGRIHGGTGVNRVTGGYRIVGEAIEFAPLATTKMPGPPAAMALEQAILGALSGRQPFTLRGDELTIGPARFTCA